MKIVFVCSSNVCRSPYCEFVARRLIAESDALKKTDIKISSAAVFNRSREIFPKTENILLREGFSREEIDAFRPRFKTDADVLKDFEEANVIIGMTKLHRLETPAEYRNKYTTLSQIATGAYIKIHDPFLDGSQEKYDATMAILRELVVLYVADLEARQLSTR